MAKALRVKRRDKSFRKLKKTHLWVPFFTTSLLYFLIGVVIIAILNMVAAYLFSTKFTSEFDSISYMSGVYALSGEEELLKMSGRTYMLMDSEGNILSQNGDNTCSFKGGMASFSAGAEKVMCYTDKEKPFFVVDSTGYIDFDRGLFIDELMETYGLSGGGSDSFSRGFEAGLTDSEADDRINVDIMIEMNKNVKVEFPLWVSVPIGDKNLVTKVVFSLNLEDIVMVIGILGLFLIIGIITIIILFINLIRNIVHQRNSLRLLTTDFVTGGHNWMWFVMKGEHMLRGFSAAKRPYVIVNVMFVGYRTYCVCHSVEAGDEILVQMHRVLNRNMGKGEMCVHTTSSNFALLLRCPDLETAKDRLATYLDQLIAMGGDTNLHFQIGIAEIPFAFDKNGRIVRRKNLDLEAEYNNACAARNSMAAKSESGIALFDDKLVEEKKWVSLVTEHQKTALANEEFVVFYQPKYDPATDKLRGAEALVRWQSPEFGFVPPGKFIPIFEDNGFITEIDHYMLSHVARDQKRWLDQGLKCVPVSVNVSRAHFIESDLAEQIRDIVDAAGTPHEYIEIELTESAFFDDKNALISTITRLQSYGFSVSMDDFGSGYSSLNSLKDMPLDVLKLDAEFFRGDNTDVRGRIVVSEAIRLAKDLNMRIVAEGVEEKGQVEFLATQGCDMIQGFIYDRPMEGEKFVDRMKSSTGSTDKTEKSENSVKTENTEKIENTSNTENTENTENTVIADNTESTENSDGAGI